ncbi:MAG: translation initiation factor IF-3 [Bacteroidales bacterium]|nr:translation initiation factor IF-3 [Bacteroidales bacterium]
MATFKPRPGGFYKPQGGNQANKPGNASATNPGFKGPNNKFRKDEDEGPRVNEQIRVPEVRVVGDNVPEQKIYPIAQALKMAQEMELDLVEIAPNAEPPVCKIIDYQKYLYQQKKKAKEMKANAAKTEIKELRFGPNTDEHDFQFKLNHAKNFLKEGNKVKAFVYFKGRSILFSEQGEKLLLRFAVELDEFGKAEKMPLLEGKRMSMIIAPIKKK